MCNSHNNSAPGECTMINNYHVDAENKKLATLSFLHGNKINALVKQGVYYVDREGRKFVCSMGMPIKFWESIGFIKSDRFFKNYGENMTINGLNSSINDHIEAKRITQKLLCDLVQELA